MRALRIVHLAIFALAAEAPALAAPASSSPGLMDFRANVFGALQSGGNGVSLQVTWNPKHKITNQYGIGLNVGPTYLPASGGGGFLALEYAALGYYNINPQWFAELGAGAQTWFTSSTSTAPEILAGVGTRLDHSRLGPIDTLFVQYGMFLQSPTTHVVKLGVQFSL